MIFPRPVLLQRLPLLDVIDKIKWETSVRDDVLHNILFINKSNWKKPTVKETISKESQSSVMARFISNMPVNLPKSGLVSF